MAVVDFSEQLKMFVPAKEAMTYHFMDRGGSPEGVMQRKLREASDPNYLSRQGGGSLIDSIAQGGVKTPLHVYHSEGDATAYGVHGPALFDGHHRLAVQNSLDPEALVPITHDSSSAAQYRRGAEVAAYKRRELERLRSIKPIEQAESFSRNLREATGA